MVKRIGQGRTLLTDEEIEDIRNRVIRGENVRKVCTEYKTTPATYQKYLDGVFDETADAPRKWQNDALCQWFSPHYWEYPNYRTGKAGVSKGINDYRQAEQICSRCPVSRECVASATGEDMIWTTRGGREPLALVRARQSFK